MRKGWISGSFPPPGRWKLEVTERGGQPLDGKNFDLHPPPPRSWVLHGGEERDFWALKTGILCLSGTFAGLFRYFFEGKNWGFLGVFWAGTGIFFPRVSGNTVPYTGVESLRVWLLGTCRIQEWRVTEFDCQGPAVYRSGESQSLTARDLPYAYRSGESQSL